MLNLEPQSLPTDSVFRIIGGCKPRAGIREGAVLVRGILAAIAGLVGNNFPAY
jgi:hypothetical protein